MIGESGLKRLENVSYRVKELEFDPISFLISFLFSVAETVFQLQTFDCDADFLQKNWSLTPDFPIPPDARFLPSRVVIQYAEHMNRFYDHAKSHLLLPNRKYVSDSKSPDSFKSTQMGKGRRQFFADTFEDA